MKLSAALPLSFAFLTLIGCTSQETTVRQAIEEANYCETAEDCVLVGSKCPFGCYIYANAQEAERIRALVDGFESQCVYGCIQSSGVECRGNRCEAITEGP